MRVERSLILSVARLLDRNFSLGSEKEAMTRRTSGQNAIHHIDAQAGVLDDLFGRAHSHDVPRLVARKVLERGFDDLAGPLPRLADAGPARGIARKAPA